MNSHKAFNERMHDENVAKTKRVIVTSNGRVTDVRDRERGVVSHNNGRTGIRGVNCL